MIKYRLLIYNIHGEVMENKAFNTYKEAEAFAKRQSASYNIQAFKGKGKVIKIKDRKGD